MIRFLVPYPVSVNRAWRNFNGRTVLSPEGRAYKLRVAWLAKKFIKSRLTGDVSAMYVLHPKLTKRGAASKTRVDVGNVDKLLSDALNGIAWEDDRQIVDLRVVVGKPIQDGGVTVFIGKPDLSFLD